MFFDRKIEGIHDFSEENKREKNHLSSCGLNQDQKSEKNGDVSRPKFGIRTRKPQSMLKDRFKTTKISYTYILTQIFIRIMHDKKFFIKN